MPERNTRLVAWSLRITGLLVQIGARRLLERATFPHGASPEISDADLAIMLHDFICVQSSRAAAREAAHLVPATALMRRLQAAGTPDVPTVSLQGGRIDRGMGKTRPLLNRTSAGLMAAAPNGKVIVVEEAGHFIPQESPGVVRDTILEVLDAAS